MIGFCLISCLSLFTQIDSSKIIQKIPLTPLNQYKSQYFPNYSDAHKSIYFTARESTHRDEDLFVSSITNNQFQVPQNIQELNQENNEGTPSLSTDGTRMIFSACDYPNTYGGCDLFETLWNGINWTKPKNLGYLINSHDWEGHPYLSKDGNSLYFSSDRPGGKGKKDIWISQRNQQGIWQIPINLGNHINTQFDEQSPFYLEDKKILIFSSDQKGGLGGLDFYQSLLTDNLFGLSQNIKPLNSIKDDAGICLGTQSNEYFISSSLSGKDLIYSVNIPDEFWLKTPPIVEKPLQSKTFESLQFEDIQFDSNQWELPSKTPNSLKELVLYLKEYTQQKVKISGHTDENGTEELNQILSEKRALSVKLYLIQQGISNDRITFQGFGYSQSSSKNQAKNRRIEIEIIDDR